jgi:predicted nucleotide-binding protein
VINGFLTAYNGAKVPREDIAHNVLAEKFDIPVAEAARVFKQIIDDARQLGMITDISGVEYVQLDARANQTAAPAEVIEDEATPQAVTGAQARPDISALFPTTDVTTSASRSPLPAEGPRDARLGRVYISHGKNKAFVDLLTKLLKFGELEAVVSIQKETVSLSLTDKVIGDMRTCGAAMIHVDAERTVTDADGAERILLNENVLIEIGAAVALYGKRFILLVGEGVELPSNLHGLYQVRYTGEKLDAEAAMRLMDAIGDIKNHSLP